MHSTQHAGAPYRLKELVTVHGISLVSQYVAQMRDCVVRGVRML
jgi:hypothetical protein